MGDVIIMDVHGFVYRARRGPADKFANCWIVRGWREPTFRDEEIQGWLPLPTP
jgi:hypothetical protein